MGILLPNLHKFRSFDKNITGDFMRKYTIFALICLCALLLVFSFYYKDSDKKQNIENSKKPTNYSQMYTLIYENGTVNLYKNGEFIRNYKNISVTDLPLTDRDNLLSGIKIKTMDEVTQIVEDFDGN